MNKKWTSGLCIALFIISCLGYLNAARAEEMSEWTDIFSFGGDLRLRSDWIDEQGTHNTDRTKLRARLGTTAKPSDQLQFKLRFATNPENPVSKNVTFGEETKGGEFGLDLASVDWHPTTTWGETRIAAGKMEMPYVRPSDLIWDHDFNPEGVALTQNVPISSTTKLIGIGAIFRADEREGSSDTFVPGGQLVLENDLAESTKTFLGAGYFSYSHVKGESLIYNSGKSFGNSTIQSEDGTLLYASDYGQFEVIARLLTDIGIPFGIYLDWVKNTEASTDEDRGWLSGVTFGKASEPLSWQLDYNYRDLEADAAFGLYADSDSFGGGTNGRGHRISAAYQLTKSVQFAVTTFLNEKKISSGDGTNYVRYQADVIFKF